MNLKKDSKQKKCWRGEDQEVLDAIRLAGLGAVGFSASTATTGMLLPPGLTRRINIDMMGN